VSLVTAAYDGNERALGRQERTLAFMVDGFDVGVAVGGRLVLTFKFGAAGRFNFEVEPEGADTLARAILGMIGTSDG
jgi:hypothetical protein